MANRSLSYGFWLHNLLRMLRYFIKRGERMKPWENPQWIKENLCATCGMFIWNRWDNHIIYKECEKELAKKVTA